MATLALSRGVPMIGGGDEQGRTQHGNNNAYCHDSELVWVDWEGADRSLRAFVQEAFAVRRRFPELRADEAYDPGSVRWFDAHGCELDAGSWRQRDLQAFALRIGEGLTLLLNAADSPVGFELPGGAWTVQLDSAGGTRPGRLDASTLQFLSR
jgi:glycogen operon protein